ncbi:MAG: efflux RND transporter periplasmic adaptor subunit [Gammaproteobacteria bacterium]
MSINQFLSSNGKSRWALLAVASFSLVALGWHLVRGSPAEAAPAHGKEGKGGGAGVVVESAIARRSDVPVYLNGLGTAQAFYTARITSRVDGQLESVAFTEGQLVHKGEVLARIDPRPFQAAFDQASATREKDVATLANAKRDLERYLSLEPDHLASRQQIDTQKSLVTQLEAQIQADAAAAESAKTQLTYTSITSPIDGNTGIRLVDPGNIVHAADAGGIVVVTQIQPISVVFTLPEDALSEVSGALAAGKVQVVALSRDGKTELDRGTLALIDNQIDPTSGTAKLKATFPNATRKLWPGEFVNARVLVRMEQGALTIPSAALQRGADGPFAYVVKPDSTVEVRKLKTEGETGDVAVIRSGLRDGERVVTSNQFRLEGGTHVKVATNSGAVAQASEFARATP